MESEPAANISLDENFLEELLSRVEDLGELKVVLQALRLAAVSGTPLVPLDRLLATDISRSIAGPHSPEPAEDRVRRSIERALANGFVLSLIAGERSSARTYIVPATIAGRVLVAGIRDGEPGTEHASELEQGPVILNRPNIFSLYERHIGPLTPLVAEQLRDAERSYPRRWIEEAVREAVDNNKQSWRYVQSILNRWEETGAPDVGSRR